MATDRETLLNMNTTASSGMSPLMEAVLNRYVLERNKQARKYTRFGQQVDIPRGKTKTIAFDKLSPLPKATQPLTEGVTPTGSAVHITRVKGEPEQFGNYVSYTDQLDFFAHDPSPEVLKYADLLTENQLETFEHLDAMELASGLNVFYTGTAASRSAVADELTVKDVRRAVTSLKRNKVQPADGKDYIAFIHPDVVFDIWSDDEWRQPHTYADTKQLYDGEIGRLFGVRFIEDPDAWVFRGTPFADKYDELTVVKTDGTKIYIAETIASGDVADFAGRKIWINNTSYTLASTGAAAGSNGSAYLIATASVTGKLIEPDMKIYPGDGGNSSGKPVYSTIILGKDAFGTSGDRTVQLINKSLGSAGTGDPLNQRGTVGWKGYRFTKILEQTKMVRIESVASA
ncbi:MAG TPA: N4-gp56 family major capsid protein [Candidatus Ornithomonoglobus merdipullorum]|uniref:N4-gp56 family major capsid protein n=1 Tax=Candidatus Ornithomonoglobus merdipullorum TaxID=2840895 RepID=A0A9D1MBL7_9FIRM|nr:N4-gp56 family major capsid protein [Candidatus Ornithomonoglobus merdipullorum]